ncbi:MAG: hypothetical protein AAB265_00420 [candidate division NC10 bacterium]
MILDFGGVLWDMRWDVAGDLDQNIAAAESVGMKAILFRVDRGHDLRAQLAALGVFPRDWEGSA